MDLLLGILELFATFTEGLTVFSVTAAMCQRKYDIRKHIAFLVASGAVYTAFIMVIRAFVPYASLITLVAVLFSLAVSFLLSKGDILLRCTSLMVTWFFFHAIDYTVSYSLVMVMDRLARSSEGTESIITSGAYRIIFILVSRVLQLLIAYLFRHIYPRVKALERKYLILLLSVALGGYVLLTAFAGLILSDSVITVQVAVILSVFFTVISLIATIFAVTVKTKYEKEKREAELMEITNTMMKKNFAEMQNTHDTIRQQVHDFKNHIRTINGMLEKDTEAKAYAEQLLSVSYKQARLCNSGNSVIDSIINCKITEAELQNTQFSYNVALTSELNIASIDICAVLANQIDNALEACRKISDEKERFVKVKIFQKESFVFFKVENSCKKNPFNSKRELVSTKSDPSGLHGYGIKNIIKTAKSYNGTVKSDYNDGVFTSVAMIPNNTKRGEEQ